jgi:transcriptional regulator with XRE-family HTH domain
VIRRDLLVARRLALGLTQEELAYRLGVDPRTLRRWESGDSTPQPLQRRPLADALGVSTAELADLLAPRPAGGPAATVAAMVAGLEQATLTRRRSRPALRLLGRAHEALGDLAFDRLAYAEATEHYHQVHEVGVELGDPDLAAGATIQLADIARRRGRHRAGLRLLAAASSDTAAASMPTQVRRYQTAARTHAEVGDRAAFDAEIGQAEALAEWAGAEAPDMAPARPQDVRLERAQGLTVLGRAAEALAIHEAEQVTLITDRQRGSYLIIRAQALAHAGHLDEGVGVALEGLALARSYGSARHVSRVQRMHDRLVTELAPSEPRLVELREALAAS